MPDSAFRPIKPMLARLTDEIPEGEGWLYEPKWDGFRVLAFRGGGEITLQSRDLKPLNRYFPEMVELLREMPGDDFIFDGEIVIAYGGRLEFDDLLLRIHPAESRVQLLASQRPSSLILFDVLALNGKDFQQEPLASRRTVLEELHLGAVRRVHVTPATSDAAVAKRWFNKFEGAGLDGIIAKRLDSAYEPGKRTMLKIKHRRTADCVVGGYRTLTEGPEVGSLLLGLYENGKLEYVGHTSSFANDQREELLNVLKPLHAEKSFDGDRQPGGPSRWRHTEREWQPVRPELVCEVSFDHLQGRRFRHASTFLRWRPDKPPQECGFDQLESTPPYEFLRIFSEEREE